MSKVADKKCQYVVKLGVPIFYWKCQMPYKLKKAIFFSHKHSGSSVVEEGVVAYMLSLLIKKLIHFFYDVLIQWVLMKIKINK